MTDPVPGRWDLSQSHFGRCRVDVLSGGETEAEDVEILDGTITEKWVLGLRSSLSLTVEPSASWLAWFQLPKLELRVYAGVTWSLSEHLTPLGVFMVDPPSPGLPLSTVSLSGSDRWKTIAQNDLLYKWPGPAGKGSELAARLMIEGGLPEVSVDVTQDVESPGVLWEGKRHDLIRDYLEPAGNTAFVDRTGLACIRTRASQLGSSLIHGQDGTLVSISPSVDLNGVYNAVGAASTKSDAIVDPPAFVSITDPSHPAHEDRIGRRQTLVTSSAIENYGDAYNYARSQLEKLSAPALGWSVECVPDPTRQPGDLIQVTSALGTINATVQSVTHPLVVDSGSKTQKITLGAVL